MIRVYRAQNARELKMAPEDEPLLEAASPAELLAGLERGDLTKGEREAVQRASSQLQGSDNARILIAANGTIFRVDRGERSSSRAARPLTVAWATAERGAPVVVAHPDVAWSGRAADALRFLGYAARRVDRTPLEAVIAAPPLAILVAANALTDELIEAASDKCAIVALVERGATPPPGAHGVLTIPLESRLVVSVIDPLIRKARSGRLKLGNATPRP